jgi:hypothetical protein
MDTWEREDNFIADVIVIDYADLLAPDPDIARLEWRNQVNKIWQRLRRLSQERACLVLTATQANARSYDEKKLLTRRNFSEDKRKLAHVTAMFGLNQTGEEKELNVLRVNPIVVREEEYSPSQSITLLQRLQKGRPIAASYK